MLSGEECSVCMFLVVITSLISVSSYFLHSYFLSILYISACMIVTSEILLRGFSIYKRA